jgi:hypothetical protein
MDNDFLPILNERAIIRKPNGTNDNITTVKIRSGKDITVPNGVIAFPIPQIANEQSVDIVASTTNP